METPAQKRVQPLDQVGRRWSLGREGGEEETDERGPGREEDGREKMRKRTGDQKQRDWGKKRRS